MNKPKHSGALQADVDRLKLEKRKAEPVGSRLIFRVVILAGVLALGALCDARAVSLRVGTVRGFPGNIVEVPVSLRYGSNESRNVVALQADVVFDADGLSDVASRSGPLLMRHILASSAPTTGTQRLLVYSSESAPLTNGVVATIPLTVRPGEYRNFPLILTNVVLVRADASQVFATNVNGSITVSQLFVAPDGQAAGFLNVSSDEVEACYVVQATTDFVTWVDVQTNSVAGHLLEFADPNAGAYPHRFYRAIVCDSATGLRIGTITQLPGGQVQFDFNGASGRNYIIQASTNLTHWESVRTNLAAGGPIMFTEPVGNHPHRFYRVQAR